MSNKYDVRMEVKFCDKHKKYYEKNVEVKLDNNELGIRLSELCSIWEEAINCIECKWKTLFGK